MRKIVLIDMDGVITDFDKGFLNRWKELYPERKAVEFEARKDFEIVTEYMEFENDAEAIMDEKSFILNLPPIEGAIEGVKKLAELYDVFICSTAISTNPYSWQEKIEWIRIHLGQEFIRKTILAKDKTMVRGDYLIDDRPELTGLLSPTWEHIIFDAPYNREVSGKRRVNWSTMLETLSHEPMSY